MKRKAKIVNGIAFTGEPTLIPLSEVDLENLPQDKLPIRILTLEIAQRLYNFSVCGVYGPDQGGEWFNPNGIWRVVVQYKGMDEPLPTKSHVPLRRDSQGRPYGSLSLGWPLVYLTTD